MDGFEFLSVVRQRFPHLPVIVISGAFRSADVPNSVLADVFFEKSQYTPDQLIARIAKLVREAPIRPAVGQMHTPVWIPHAESEQVGVTCTHCLRTFSVPTPHISGTHDVACAFCSSTVRFRVS